MGQSRSYQVNMRIVLIGAGNVATHLGAALIKGEHEVLQVFSRSNASAVTLADALQCQAINDLSALRKDADVYILSVSDAVLPDVAKNIPQTDALYLHTAGSMPIDVLPMPRRGVLYPMQTFSKARAMDFHQVPLLIESQTDESLLRSLAESLSNNVHVMTSQQRKRLHLAAVFACNFVNHMYDLSAQLLAEAEIPFEVMLPLIDETAGKAHKLPPHQAQTGPAVRDDQNVMHMHEEQLAHDPQKQRIYRLLSQSINLSFNKK